MLVPDTLYSDTTWWIRNLPVNKNHLTRDKYVIEIFSDASDLGWGIFCNKISSQGFWSNEERKHHNNYKELLALYFGLKCFASDLLNVSILCRVDNTTALAYVQFPKLNALAREIWPWCEKRKLFIFASYIKSRENKEADTASRNLQMETEWTLANWAYNRLIKKWGKPTIDLFATRINTKCTTFISWQRDPEAYAIGAFTVNCEKFNFYAIPPFSVISKTLEKIISDKAEGILVVPNWVSQPWYPIFTSLLTDDPIIFSPNGNLLYFGRVPHPLAGILSLMARLSGKHYL